MDSKSFKIYLSSFDSHILNHVKSLPEDICQLIGLSNLRSRSDLKLVIGWVGGVESLDALWVNEYNSELLDKLRIAMETTHTEEIKQLYLRLIKSIYYSVALYAKEIGKPVLYVYKDIDEDIAPKIGAKLVKNKHGEWWKLKIKLTGLRVENHVNTIASLITEDVDIINEEIDVDKLKRMLSSLGYENISIIKSSDSDFKKVDVLFALFDPETGQTFKLEDKFDVNEYNLPKALSNLDLYSDETISEEELEELEELKDDAYLFITASKKVSGGKWLGVTIMSLDDPRFQVDYSPYQPEDEDEEEDDLTMSVDELKAMFDAPSWNK